ncbi:MAG: ABC transporter substrate-binding protein [Alphaproteobacteria bacterium]
MAASRWAIAAAWCVIVLAGAGATHAQGQAPAFETVRIAFLAQFAERPPKLSNLDQPPEDDGVRGGRLAIMDNNTTGRFMKQRFELREVIVPPGEDAVAAFGRLLADGYRHVIVAVPADVLLRMADLPAAAEAQLYNVGARDDRLRNEDCRKNVLHLVPSRAMLADALAQYLNLKRWRDWFLVVGRRAGDRLFAAAIRRAARRFGGKIVAEKEWTFGPDARRTAQAEVPVFTQDVDYDVLIVADEIGEFGEYLSYRTWEPKLVAGTQGLTPTWWHRTHEQWGAAQLQSRFLKMAGRRMTALDYGVWAAVRSIGEAATRTRSAAFGALVGYMHGPAFVLAGFKGRKLTFRDWDGQLRQPILLAAPKALVSVSPQPGFLHQSSTLDTLGYDRPETKCRLESR